MVGLQVFKILPDGTTTEITTDRPIKDVLETSECYVIVADEVRKVYLWKGITSNVRSKFIGAKLSQEIRGQVGLHYTVLPLDEGEEEPEFIQLIGGKTEAGHAKEIKAPVTQASAVHPLMEKNIFGTPRPAEGMNIAGSKERAVLNRGPLYTGEGSMAALIRDESQVDFQEVMKKLEEIQIPAGFERELIIIGNQAYSVVEKVQQFLGKKEVTKEISKVGSIPEGIFFAEDYSPRILSENGKIIAIEFLKCAGAPIKPVKSKNKREILKEQIKEQLGGN
ncbi:MAG: hypothetical protein KAT66_05645 [Candidatus Lokiarchaeota archaeon]|nr:hypothetical protein [Candidatus Lokiarchaeota archaeon]